MFQTLKEKMGKETKEMNLTVNDDGRWSYFS